MIDQKKVRLLKIIGVSLLVLFVGFIVFTTLTSHKASPKTKASRSQSSQSSKVTRHSSTSPSSSTDTLDSSVVLKFLHAYFTKSELGANHKTYKPLVTPAFYKAAVTAEKQQQATKGQFVNYALSSSKIYIDADDEEAIATVTYTYVSKVPITQKTSSGTTQSTPKLSQKVTDTYLITFLWDGSHFLVSQMSEYDPQGGTTTASNK